MNKQEIKVKSFIWKQKMYITGYYQFEIIIKYHNQQESIIYRRFSEIEWLQEGLIKYNPGSRIPNLPGKNFWCNLSVNNSLEIEKRKQQIETHLNYIHNHKYLSQNPCFIKFLSNDFDPVKVKEEKPSGFFSKMYGLTSYIPYLSSSSSGSSGQSSNKKKHMSYIDDNSSLNNERENLMRLKKGLDSLLENMQKHIIINEEKMKSLNMFISTTKELNFFSLDYKTNSSDNFEDDQIDDVGQLKNDKKLANNLQLINGYYEKSRTYQNLLESTVVEQLTKYKGELEGLIEIFERKKIQDALYQSILRGESFSNSNNKENDPNIQKELIDSLNEQFQEEIDSFKANRENDIIMILQKFFKDKSDADKDIAELYDYNKN